jgi:hypothetical protein
MNAFASPEEAFPYEYQEFPKPEDQVTEYANLEGAVDFQLKNFSDGEPFILGADSAPVVQPVVFQDFKEVLAQAQS